MSRSTPEEVSFVWSHHKILSTYSKIRTTCLTKTPSESTPEEFLNE